MDSQVISRRDVLGRPTLKDVARVAGLSEATVSLAINRSPETCPLKPSTRRRAVDAAQRLGYQPSFRGRALASGRTSMVGFVYARSAPMLTGMNEILVESLIDGLSSHGYTQMLISLKDETSAAQRLIGRDHMDGVVALFPGAAALQQMPQLRDLPTIQVNDLTVPHLPAVVADDRAGAAMLTRHLLGLGHRDIAFISRQHTSHYSAQSRREGYETTMVEAGLGAHIRTVTGQAPGQAVAMLLGLTPRPTAIIAMDHAVAIDVMHALWRSGIRIPDQMSVASFNDVFPVARMQPPLTVMAVPAEAMGHAAADMLVQWMQSGRPPAEQRLWFNEQLIVRESTAPPSGPARTA